MVNERPVLPRNARYGIMEVCKILRIAYNTAQAYKGVRLQPSYNECDKREYYTSQAIIDCWEGKKVRQQVKFKTTGA